MGQYPKTRYPGVFQYVGPNGMAHGIDYRIGGKKHLEIISFLLSQAQENPAEKKKQAKKGMVISASEKKWSGRPELNRRSGRLTAPAAWQKSLLIRRDATLLVPKIESEF